MIIVDHNSDISYINNTRLKRIEQIHHREINGKDYSKTRIIINAAIQKLNIYDNPLNEDQKKINEDEKFKLKKYFREIMEIFNTNNYKTAKTRLK